MELNRRRIVTPAPSRAALVPQLSGQFLTSKVMCNDLVRQLHTYQTKCIQFIIGHMSINNLREDILGHSCFQQETAQGRGKL